MKNANVIADACIGCGVCCDMCEDVFRLNDDGKAEVCGDCTDENAVQECIDACPVTAIEWA